MTQPFSASAPLLVRQRFVADILDSTLDTGYAPTPLEQELLARYVRGELTLAGVLTQLKKQKTQVA